MTMARKILFIDDEPYFMRAHIDTLKDEGYEVDEAEDGDEALRKLEASDYDLIILDIIIPAGSIEDTKNGMRTGLRIQEVIRRQLRLPTPILFLTVVENREVHRRIGQVEQESERPRPVILVKPVLPSELVEHTRGLLGD
jgi:CheY-like chemotaxis protein